MKDMSRVHYNMGRIELRSRRSWLKAIFLIFNLYRYCSWLRHDATILEVGGSISDEIMGMFSNGLYLAADYGLGSTQPLTVMSTRRQDCKGDNLTAICEPIT
jgi:hypothetical protein